MKGGINRLIGGVVMVLMCVSMWGCGLFDEEVTTTINEKRSGGMPIALLDDSLAIVYSSRGWEEHAESCDYYSSCDRGTMNQGVFLVNYRKKMAPYWGDTTKGVLYIAKGLACDSTVVFYKDDGYFGFWKVGENLEVRKKIKWNDGCVWKNFYTHARPWQNGNVLLKDVYPCPYAVLDTATGNVKKLELTGDYAWLEGCDDITYIDGEVVCVKRLGKPTGTITLFSGGNIVDSLVYDHYTGNPPVFWGEYVAAYIYKKDFVEGDLIAKFSKNSFERNYPETWMKSYDFIDSVGNAISYSSEDLIVTK